MLFFLIYSKNITAQGSKIKCLTGDVCIFVLCAEYYGTSYFLAYFSTRINLNDEKFKVFNDKNTIKKYAISVGNK